MIAEVILWSNATVMVFDPEGRHLPGYQGRFDRVLERVLADAPPGTRFRIGAWGGGMLNTTRECFACWREVVRAPGVAAAGATSEDET
jgi:hypothetical protein